MVQERTNAARNHATDLDGSGVTAAARFVHLSWPGLSSAQIAADLGNRISASNVRQWRTGKRYVPAWVLEEMRARKSAELEAIAQIKTGPGIQAGFRNLAAWRAAQNSKR